MIEITKTCTVAFMKARISLVIRCREKCAIWKKTENGGNMFHKAVANRFRGASKLISRAEEQKNCLWATFYQMDFMKR